MRVTGGIFLNHSVTGQFITCHRKEIEGGLFRQIMAKVLQRSGGTGSAVAGDGTVIEAESVLDSRIEKKRLQGKKTDTFTRSPSYTEYGSPACKTCPQKSRCTRSKEGRQMRRYAGDDAKDALRQVMRQPAAQRHFSKRQAWVEPVFSVLRGKQGLNRFRRKGLAGVRLEFSLHIIAYNMGRALAFSLCGYLAKLCRIVTQGSVLWDRIKWKGYSGVYFFRLSREFSEPSVTT